MGKPKAQEVDLDTPSPVQSSKIFREHSVLQSQKKPFAIMSARSAIPFTPAELWAEIFTHYLPSFHDSESAIEYEKHLLLLSSVCGHLRAVALATPRLWSRIYVCTGRSESERSRVGTWLERSRGCSLTLILKLGHGVGGSDGDVIRDILLHSRRWEHLSISADSERRVYSEFKPFLKGKGNLPLLKEVGLDVPLLGHGDSLLSMFRDAPMLRSVNLRRMDSVHLLEELPLHQLRRLSLGRETVTSARDFWGALVKMPDVEELSVSVDVGPAFNGFQTELPELPIVHPKLRSLAIDVAIRGDEMIIQRLRRETADILDNLVVSRLESFSIACGESHWPCEESVRAFLERNGRSVERLKVLGKREGVKRAARWAVSARMREVLGLVPRLATLEVMMCRKRLGEVIRMIDMESLLPRAEKLVLGVAPNRPDEEGDIDALKKDVLCLSGSRRMSLDSLSRSSSCFILCKN
ncbi:hypothetical protein V5O48_004934 [Marasmius crinis-equi]|uniref:F-box domain-containing protein n=1 Tax=Marasmius crinis-equi TaxID=585013 RepID=A0ABR3FPN7_9AGAR